jgi:cobalt/nickel transport system permease protein
MALLGCLGGYAIFVALRGLLPATKPMVVASAAIAAGLSVVLASVGFWAEYAIGGTTNVDLHTVFLAMVGTHALIGIGEAVITALTIGAVMTVRPDLVFGARDLLPGPVVLPPEDVATGGRRDG